MISNIPFSLYFLPFPHMKDQPVIEAPKIPQILLIEDDPGIASPLFLYLSQSGFEINIARDGEEAMLLFEKSMDTIDLIILDLNLPKKDGFSVCSSIRESSNIPIIILSARDSEDDKVRALELGADDYIAKPFSPRELVARVRTVLKRLAKPTLSEQETILVFGELRLDTIEYLLSLAGEAIKVTKTEFLILAYLIQHHDHIVERETLMKEIIGYEHYLYDRTIDTHMKNLRRKIGESAHIETVRGIGYRITNAL